MTPRRTRRCNHVGPTTGLAVTLSPSHWIIIRIAIILQIWLLSGSRVISSSRGMRCYVATSSHRGALRKMQRNLTAVNAGARGVRTISLTVQ